MGVKQYSSGRREPDTFPGISSQPNLRFLDTGSFLMAEKMRRTRGEEPGRDKSQGKGWAELHVTTSDPV